MSLPIASFNWEKKKPKPRPLKKPLFSKELLEDGSWWRKDFDFCSFNSHLSSMCVQKDVIPWRKGNVLSHRSPHSHFTFQVSMSHFGSHLQTTADSSLKQSGLCSLFLCIACMVLWVFVALVHHEVYSTTSINPKVNVAKYLKCLNSTEQIFSDTIQTQKFSMFDSKWIFSVTEFIFGYMPNPTNGFLWSYAGKEFGLFSLKYIVLEKMWHVRPTGRILSWAVSDK